MFLSLRAAEVLTVFSDLHKSVSLYLPGLKCAATASINTQWNYRLCFKEAFNLIILNFENVL